MSSSLHTSGKTMSAMPSHYKQILIVGNSISKNRILKVLPQVFSARSVLVKDVSQELVDESSVVVVDLSGTRGGDIKTLKRALDNNRSVPATCFVDPAKRLEIVQAEAIGARDFLSRQLGMEDALRHIRSLVQAQAIISFPDNAPAKTVEAVKTISGLFDELPVFTVTSKPLRMRLLLKSVRAIIDALHADGIVAWLEAVQSHHSHTYRHSMLVSGYATAFADIVEMAPADKDLFVAGALVHDIGKTKIPLAILDKPGALTSEEFDLVKKHPVYSDEILAINSEMDPVIRQLARHHHEYLDGSGYPDGLSGEKISPMIRMLTICDIYSALIEKRSYKECLSPRQAFTILFEMGSKIDLQLLKQFRVLALDPDLGAVRKRLQPLTQATAEISRRRRASF